MSYRTFIAKTTALAAREGYKVRHHKTEDGRFFADFSDGSRVVGNHTALRVAVYDSTRNHMGFATL